MVNQSLIPQTLVKEILKLLHDNYCSSQPGKDKTYRQAQLKYFWPGMNKDIYDYIENYLKCAKEKGNTPKLVPMLTYPIPQKPWERVHIDTLELPMSDKGYKYVFVAIVYFSRFCILQPIPNTKAETIASAIYDQIICNSTTPKVLVSDNGTEFNNKLFENLCTLLKMQKINILVNHPTGIISPHSITWDTWDTWIPYVECTLNNQINIGTNETPNFIIFGEDKILPYEILIV